MPLFVAGVLAEIFLDARRLAFEVAQVVQLRAAHLAAPLHGHRVDRRTVRLEYALDAGAMRNLAHGERRIQAGILLGDAHAFIGLHALAIAFLDLDVHHDGIAGPEFGQLARDLCGFELLEDVHDAHRSLE